MTIYVDSREPKILKQMENAIVAELEAGDFQFFTSKGLHIGIERKEISDFVSSFLTGKLSEQLYTLLNDVDIAVLLIEGYMSVNQDGFVRTKNRFIRLPLIKICAYLQSIQESGVRLQQSPSLKYTGSIVKALSVLYEKGSHSALFKRKSPSYSWGKPSSSEEKLYLVQGLPGVSVELGQRLLTHFGFPLKVFQATPDELCEVEGIGKVRAERIYRSLRPTTQLHV